MCLKVLITTHTSCGDAAQIHSASDPYEFGEGNLGIFGVGTVAGPRTIRIRSLLVTGLKRQVQGCNFHGLQACSH